MEAQENSQTEQNAQAPKKRELALVSRSTYIKEKALQWIFFACAFLAVVTVILIFVFTTYSALPVFTDIGLADFFSFTWAPSEGHYGIVSLLAGSVLADPVPQARPEREKPPGNAYQYIRERPLSL